MWAEGIGKSQLEAIVIAQLRVFSGLDEDSDSVPSGSELPVSFQLREI